MSDPTTCLTCPHCGEVLDRVDMPRELAWDNPIQHVCFNDDCSYFVAGWDWMWERYGNRVSYRYRVVDEKTGRNSPLMVWSRDAIKDRIIPENDH
ncbi:MAG: hypothetical protein QNJ97_15965 [Myxococcota bacterium]|nr:hypothetical protein [Myxococcota bacterium]